MPNFSPGQQSVANAIVEGRHLDPAVVDVAKNMDATARKREAKDLWQLILSEPGHAYHHPADANHLLAVESMMHLGELAFEDVEP